MTVEIIGIEQFDAALKSAGEFEVEHTGMEKGEHIWLVHLDDRVSIKVRSSIGRSGLSADSGEDSIRMWLVDRNSDKAVSVKVDKLTQRTTGWELRVSKKLNELALWRQLSGDCQSCGEPRRIFKVRKSGQNTGRMFAKYSCNGHGTGWVWLDEVEDANNSEVSGRQSALPLAERDADAHAMRNDGGQDVSPIQDTLSSGPDSNMDEAEERVPAVLGFLAKDSDDIPFELVEAAGHVVTIPQPEDPPLDEELNEHQQRVVTHMVAGPTVVEAAPGSGKTRTGEQQIAALLDAGLDPARLGYFTFSNQAAKESRRRIARTLFPDATPAEIAFLEDPHNEERTIAMAMSKDELDTWKADPRRMFIIDRVATIHALSYRLLRWYGYKLHVLRDGDWQERELVRDTIAELDWDEGYKAVSKWLSMAINSLVLPEQSEPWFAARLFEMGGPVWVAPNLAEVYRRRQDFMKANGLIDFDMMQARVVWLLRNDPKFREWASSLFDVILVDEAQDTSPIQSEILFTLVKKHGRIQFLADVDQSMYKFRGAEPEVVRSQFNEHWGVERIVRFNLPINYRSTRSIIEWAAELIGYNYDQDNQQYLKPFEPGPTASEGEPVTYLETEEFDDLTDEIAALVTDNPGDFFILSRTRAECSTIHTRLISLGVPSVNKSGGLLLGAPHIRKVLAYLRLACNYQDARNDEEVLFEIANVASAGFRAPQTHRRHRDGCHAKPWENCGCPVIREEDIDTSHVRYYGRKAIQEAGGWAGIKRQSRETVRFKDNFGTWQTKPKMRAKGASDLIQFVEHLERHADSATGCLNVVVSECILPWLQAEEGLIDDDLAENGKAEDFQVLMNLAQPGQTVIEFLEELDVLAAGEGSSGEADSAIIATYHWSKGSQRPQVICNTTRLPIIPPSTQPGRLPTGSPPSLEEERRLLYVGVTRAQHRAYLAGSRKWNDQEVGTSLFVSEMGMS